MVLWDILSAVASVTAGFLLKFGFVRQVPEYYLSHQTEFIVISCFLTIGFTMLFRGYQKNLRRAALYMPLRVGASAFATGALILWVDRSRKLGVPIEVMVITSFTLFALQSFGRVGLSLILPYFQRKEVRSLSGGRVLIYGAGELGRLLVERLNQGQGEKLVPVAFVDDNPQLVGRRMEGLKILGPLEKVERHIILQDIDGIVVAIDQLSGEKLKVLLNLCERNKLQVKRFGLTEQRQTMEQATLGEINLEDLLRRKRVSLDMEAVRQLLLDSVVLVT